MRNLMKIKLSYTLVIIFMLLSFLFLMPVLATDGSADANSSRDSAYDISAYDVDVNVKPDNVLEVSETITANFHKERHGIYRNIPLISKAKTRVDNQSSFAKRIVKVDNISVTDSEGNPIKYTEGREQDFLILTIGDKNKTIEGSYKYIIKYNYNIGDDGIDEYDQINYNLIGYEWNTTISNITFAVHMPKEFKNRGIRITSGFLKSNKDLKVVDYTVNGNTISGKIKDSFFYPGMGLSFATTFPQGYFEGFTEHVDKSLIILFLMFSFFGLITFIVFPKNEKIDFSEEINPFAGFNPPTDINPAEAGFIIDGHVKITHIVALIIHWANKGYLSITNDINDNFILTKNRSTDDLMKPYEKLMFRKLFEGRETVTALELKYTFRSTISKVKADISKSFKEPSRRLYTKGSMIVQRFSYILAALSMGILIGKAVERYCFSTGAGISSGICTFLITITVALTIGYCSKIRLTKPKSALIWVIMGYIIFVAISVVLIINNTDLYYEAFAGALATVVCVIVGTYSIKRTEQYNLWIKETVKLRDLIEKSGQRKIEAMLEGNPELLYSILPYAYAFGYVNRWMGKFSKVELLPPHWYSSEQNFSFNTIFFANNFNHNFLDYEISMDSSPTNSSIFSSHSSGAHYDGGGDYNGGGHHGGGDYSGGDYGGGDVGGGGGGDW